MSGDPTRDRGCGAVFVVSAPSGSGKSTLVRRLVKSIGGIRFSVSHTTRPPRPEEEQGRDYHFVDLRRFEEMREQGAFLEWAEVHGQFYGTSRAEIDAAAAGGEDLLLDLDVRGAEAVRRSRAGSILIFILPPGLAEVRRRLATRGTAPDEIERRLETAAREITQAGRFDYLVLNQRIEESEGLLEAIVLAERSRLERRRDAWERVAATFQRP